MSAAKSLALWFPEGNPVSREAAEAEWAPVVPPSRKAARMPIMATLIFIARKLLTATLLQTLQGFELRGGMAPRVTAIHRNPKAWLHPNLDYSVVIGKSWGYLDE
jgi:hypothetical protein